MTAKEIPSGERNEQEPAGSEALETEHGGSVADLPPVNRLVDSDPADRDPTDHHPAQHGSRELDPRLRERAEKLVGGRQAHAQAQRLGEQDVLRLVHELQVHQVELKMPNDELRQAQIDLALSAERYSDLYDFAPVGYLSVSVDAIIRRANLTAASLLGMERADLAGKSLYRFVAPDHIARFQAIRRRLILPELTESAELILQPAEGDPFWARLEIVTREDRVENSLLWQVAISNIEPQKRAEQILQRVNEELEDQVERRTEQLSLANRQLLEEIDRRRDAEAELREREEDLERRVTERTAELGTLLNVARDMSATLEIDAVLEIILGELQTIVPYQGCGIFLLQGKLLTLIACHGPLRSAGLIHSQTTLDDSPLLQMVIQQRRPLIIPDMDAVSPITLAWQRTAGALHRQLLHQSRAWMGVPMISHGEVIGVLRLDHERPGYFTDQHADLAFTLASQAAVAVVNARLYGQAQRVAAIEERQRLARELHDSVAQTFYSIALTMHSAKAQLASNPEVTQRKLDHVLELAEAGLTEMKALIFDLQMEGLRRDGLVQALQRHVDALVARNDVQVQAELGPEPAAAAESKEAIYGIVREALQNVVRHAGATELWLKLSHGDDVLCVEVRDNGKGFAADAAGAGTLGIRSMRERATSVGGAVEISSTPGEGSVVRARIPTGGAR